MSTDTFNLPALRSLGDTKILIAQDSREQCPLKFKHFPSMVCCLGTADYSIVGYESEIGIEKKSIDDLVSCCVGENRERFERELHRLRGFRFKRLAVIGSRTLIEVQRYRSRIAPKAVLATIGAFEIRWDVSVTFFESAEEAALQIERWFFFFYREQIKRANDLLQGSRKATELRAATNGEEESAA
jgi:ERCC4-type nuclease